MIARAIAAAFALMLVATDMAGAAELLMFTRRGCPWCAKFEAEVGKIYPQTDEGRQAPLRRIDIDAPSPADIKGVPADRLTPTFVLVDKGREIGRIRGYAGQDFFFGQLQRLIRELPGGDGTRG